MATRVTSKGQVTIPKGVRDYLGITPGTAVTFDVAGDGRVTLARAHGASRPPSRLSKLRGIAGPGPTTDEIMLMLRGEIEALPK